MAGRSTSKCTSAGMVEGVRCGFNLWRFKSLRCMIAVGGIGVAWSAHAKHLWRRCFLGRRCTRGVVTRVVS